MGLHNNTFDIFSSRKMTLMLISFLTEKVNTCLRLDSYFFLSCLDLIRIHKNKIQIIAPLFYSTFSDMIDTVKKLRYIVWLICWLSSLVANYIVLHQCTRM